MRQFEKWVNDFLPKNSCLEVDNATTEEEKIINLRSMILDFYASKIKAKLVVGMFQQRKQKEHEYMIEFANNWMMVFGVETIYCVKDREILSNIEKGGKRNG